MFSTEGLLLDEEDENLNKIAEVYQRSFLQRKEDLDATVRPEGVEIVRPDAGSPLVRVDVDDASSVLAEWLRLNPAVAKNRVTAAGIKVEYKPRPPVVSVMGHVDHGKTSLLDALRNASVAAGEVGGITQSVGAFEVEIGGRKATFIDTPGHHAFSSMRSAAAQATDLIVCVIAATDGIQSQTAEVLALAAQRGCPLVVAVTKVDIVEPDMEALADQLALHGFTVEARGGDVLVVPVVSVQRRGLAELVEAVNLAAELCDPPPTAPTPSRAEGVVLESDAASSSLSVIALRGAFAIGVPIVCGQGAFQITRLSDYTGEPLTASAASQPVTIRVQSLGRQAAGQMVALPPGGSPVVQVGSVAEARTAADALVRSGTTTAGAASAASVTLRDFERLVYELGRHAMSDTVTVHDATGVLQGVDEAPLEESGESAFAVGRKIVQRVFINVVVVADTHGSLAAAIQELSKLPTCEVVLRVVHADTVGATIPSRLLRVAKGCGAAVLSFKAVPACETVDNPTPPPGFERLPASRAMAVCVPSEQPTPGAFDRFYRCGQRGAPAGQSAAARGGPRGRDRSDDGTVYAAHEGHVPLFTFEVVYDLVGVARSIMEASLPPAVRMGVTGEATVLAVFPKSFNLEERERIRTGRLLPYQVAGATCTSGALSRAARRIEVFRMGKLVLTASAMESLRHFKAEVDSIEQGKECGVAMSGYDPVVNDTVRQYGVRRDARTLDDSDAIVVPEADE